MFAGWVLIHESAHRFGHLPVDDGTLLGQRLQPGLSSATQHDSEPVEQSTQGVHGRRVHSANAGASGAAPVRLLLGVLDRHMPNVPVLRAAASPPSRRGPAAAARGALPTWPAPASCGRPHRCPHRPSAVATRSLPCPSLPCPSRKSCDPSGAPFREVDLCNFTLALDAVRRHRVGRIGGGTSAEGTQLPEHRIHPALSNGDPLHRTRSIGGRSDSRRPELRVRGSSPTDREDLI